MADSINLNNQLRNIKTQEAINQGHDKNSARRKVDSELNNVLGNLI